MFLLTLIAFLGGIVVCFGFIVAINYRATLELQKERKLFDANLFYNRQFVGNDSDGVKLYEFDTDEELRDYRLFASRLDYAERHKYRYFWHKCVLETPMTEYYNEDYIQHKFNSRVRKNPERPSPVNLVPVNNKDLVEVNLGQV